MYFDEDREEPYLALLKMKEMLWHNCSQDELAALVSFFLNEQEDPFGLWRDALLNLISIKMWNVIRRGEPLVTFTMWLEWATALLNGHNERAQLELLLRWLRDVTEATPDVALALAIFPHIKGPFQTQEVFFDVVGNFASNNGGFSNFSTDEELYQYVHELAKRHGLSQKERMGADPVEYQKALDLIKTEGGISKFVMNTFFRKVKAANSSVEVLQSRMHPHSCISADGLPILSEKLEDLQKQVMNLSRHPELADPPPSKDPPDYHDVDGAGKTMEQRRYMQRVRNARAKAEKDGTPYKRPYKPKPKKQACPQPESSSSGQSSHGTKRPAEEEAGSSRKVAKRQSAAAEQSHAEERTRRVLSPEECRALKKAISEKLEKQRMENVKRWGTVAPLPPLPRTFPNLKAAPGPMKSRPAKKTGPYQKGTRSSSRAAARAASLKISKLFEDSDAPPGATSSPPATVAAAPEASPSPASPSPASPSTASSSPESPSLASPSPASSSPVSPSLASPSPASPSPSRDTPADAPVVAVSAADLEAALDAAAAALAATRAPKAAAPMAPPSPASSSHSSSDTPDDAPMAAQIAAASIAAALADAPALGALDMATPATHQGPVVAPVVSAPPSPAPSSPGGDTPAFAALAPVAIPAPLAATAPVAAPAAAPAPVAAIVLEVVNGVVTRNRAKVDKIDPLGLYEPPKRARKRPSDPTAAPKEVKEGPKNKRGRKTKVRPVSQAPRALQANGQPMERRKRKQWQPDPDDILPGDRRTNKRQAFDEAKQAIGFCLTRGANMALYHRH
ncbi:nucleolar protein dao-5-like [Neocloeon triangulifer]|uniref:nucleolar protein dao-5-like n=1 Tax=Neocloeon triangulifer TaxID=2078957 RepID=UPI00286F1690|nr:nucleolar protein dao-5-like [Neocloeon triangulifer]